MAWCRQEQAITWANVDLDGCRHMASIGPNELIDMYHNTAVNVRLDMYHNIIRNDNNIMP